MLRRRRVRLVAGLAALAALAGCGSTLGPEDNTDLETAPYSEILDAEGLIADGDPAGAETALTSLLEAHPGSLLAHRAQQDARRAQMEPGAYTRLYRTGTTERPGDSVAWYLYGRAQIEQPAEARAAFERALELDPTNAWAVAGLAYLRYSHGDLFGAVTVYEDGVSKAPRSAWMRLLVANQYLELKLYIYAKRHLRIARKLDPDNLEIKAALAKTIFALGEVDKAIELLEQLRDLEPRIAHPYPTLAALYLRKGRSGDADVVYREGLQLGMAPDDELAAEIRSGLVLERLRAESGLR